LAETAANHVRIGYHKVAANGQIPHQVSPSGKIVGAGNAQETSLWVMAIGDVYRWTGDAQLVTELLPTAVRGLFEYTLGTLNPDGDGYPVGQGQVEIEGMTQKNIDSACYVWAALGVLRELAIAVRDPALAERARAAATAIAQRFDADWWDAANGTYAAVLATGTRQLRPARVQTVLAPLEVGLATPEHATATLAALRRGYVDLGLIKGAGGSSIFGGLTAGTLSRAAYRYGDAGLGFEILGRMAESLEHGAIGMFHERMPDKFCFVQLWSAATFVRGVVEDLLGLRVDAGAHRLAFAPHLPREWDHAELERLRFGGHAITARVSRDELAVTHLVGPAALAVSLGDKTFTVAPGATAKRRQGV
jgi:glycogen debranching enzyme